MATKVKKRRRGVSRISSKNQVTIPVTAMHAARLHPGDELRVEVNADGNVVLSHDDTDVLEQFFGSMPGLSRAADLEGLRDEWER